CSGEQEIDYDLQIFDRPASAFTITQECINEPVKFLDSTNTNSRPVITWFWDFGDGTGSAVKNPTHAYSTPGSYNVSFSAVTDIGCLSDTSKKSLVVVPLPVAGFTLSTIACISKSLNFLDKSTPAIGLTKWSWNFGDGQVSTDQKPSHTYSATGKYTVKLDVESITGCKSSFSMIVNVGALPVANFSVPEVCLNDPFAAFTDSSAIIDNSQSQFSYAWNFGDANATPANPNTSSVKDPLHKYLSVGIYSVNLKVTSKDGCSVDTTKKFTVNGAIPKADFTVKAGSSLCSNKDVIINDLSTVDFGNITRVEIYWDYANDPTVKTLDDDPIPGKTYSHKYNEYGSPATKTFQVVYVAYSGISCLQQQTKTIVLLASPQIKFDTLLPVCEEVPAFQVTVAKETFGFAGTGSYTGKGISSAGLFNPKVAGNGIQTITYHFMASNGCSTQQDKTILIFPTPLADAGPDRTVLEGGSIIIAAKAGTNSSYLWTPATAIDNTTLLTPKVYPVDNTRYRLTVNSSYGCTSSDEVLVTVLKEVKVPNAFSPNGDGINDTWNIQYLESYPGATVEVYNRYGQLVFRTTGYSKPWDGRYNGSILPIGTYYWIISPKNGRARMNGSVTIVR
ncbi:MAG: PKD domain-containing protein, partial [Ginsengibacter sp.]